MVVPHRISARGGDPEPLLVEDLEDGAKVIMPRLLPGGRALLATLQAPSLDGPRIIVLNLQNGALKTVARGHDAQFVEPETLLYVQRDRVMTARFSPQTGELSGPERQSGLETPAISSDVSDSYSGFYAATASRGMLLYPAGHFGQSSKLYWLDRDGRIEETGLEGSSPRLDSTGRHALTTLIGNVWLVDLENAVRTQLTFNGTSIYPIWSQDDREVVFGDLHSGGFRPYALAIDGRSEIRPLVDNQVVMELHSPVPTSFHPDGRLLLYGVDPETNRDIWMLGKDGTLVPVLRTEANERAGAISPDGELLAYVSDEEGTDEILIRQFPDTGRRWRVSQGGGSSAVWSRDGTELFFRSGDTIMVVSVSGGGPLRIGEPREVFTNHRLDLDIWGNKTFDVAPDGRLFISMRESHDVRTRVVLNWDPEAGKNTD